VALVGLSGSKCIVLLIIIPREQKGVEIQPRPKFHLRCSYQYRWFAACKNDETQLKIGFAKIKIGSCINDDRLYEFGGMYERSRRFSSSMNSIFFRSVNLNLVPQLKFFCQSAIVVSENCGGGVTLCIIISMRLKSIPF
jgi:hypothetical protein